MSPRELPSELCPFTECLFLQLYLKMWKNTSVDYKVHEGNPHAAQWHRPELCLSNQKGHTLENDMIIEHSLLEPISRIKSKEGFSRKGQFLQY